MKAVLMTLKIAIQMDDIRKMKIKKDSTFVLMLEAQKRGYTLFYYQAPDLSLEDGRVYARGYPATVRREDGNHFTLGEARMIDLRKDVDMVLMRQDPPFDMSYITATHILEHLKGDTLVLNDPAGVRNAPEKILVTHFPDLLPPTLISASAAAIKDFYARHGDIILKPLYGNGGEQIYRIDSRGQNLNPILEMFAEFYREPIIAQAYIPEAKKGDKRIILIDGEPVGAVLRVPQGSEERANFDAGGIGQKTELTAREIDICRAIGPYLKEHNLTFTGIDVIGDYLTEINVTSPTGLQQINALDGVCLEAQLWDAFEAKLNG